MCVCCVFRAHLNSINGSWGAIDECYPSVERKWFRGTRFGYHADSSARWGRSQHGVGLPVTAQTHTWHTWQRRLSQSADAVGVWVPLEPRQDWCGVFHRQLEGKKTEEWRRGKKRKKDSMGSVTGHTETSRQCVSERGEWRREVMRCRVNTKDKNLHYPDPESKLLYFTSKSGSDCAHYRAPLQ